MITLFLQFIEKPKGRGTNMKKLIIIAMVLLSFGLLLALLFSNLNEHI